jgi:prepilin-type N-terminal cleavage/methylation domain-containing protein
MLELSMLVMMLSDKKGFTLIELLVTIAIIAIISVVAVALFNEGEAFFI